MEQYQRVVLFGGVYNNYLALQQLLKTCDRIGVDAIFCLGDLGGFGPHPDRCFPLLRDGRVLTVAGNYDISLAQGEEDCGCGYTDPRDNYFAQVSYDYTFAHTSDENKAWMKTLPPQRRFLLGKHSVLLCHGSPRRTNEFLWESSSPDHLLEKFATDYEADVVCCTHTGVKWHRTLPQGRNFVNVGVIGRPENDGQPQVWFAVLDQDGDRFRCRFHPLEYDHEQLAAEMKQEGLPEEFTATVLTGWWTTCLEIMPAKERQRGRF
jgi:predicted phosphodiesterase